MKLEKKSVKERKFNKKLYEKIFTITGKPKKISDLGCGLNPLYFPYKGLLEKASGKEGIYYIAADIDKGILKKVKKYFKKNKIRGEVLYLDIKDTDEIKRLENVDVVFIFKVFDIFSKNKKLAIEIIKNLNAKFVVISFATKTASGKKMKNPKRDWFEKVLRKIKYDYKILRFYNEIFYLVKKD